MKAKSVINAITSMAKTYIAKSENPIDAAVVRIKSKNNCCQILSINSNVSIAYKIEGGSEQEFDVTVDAKKSPKLIESVSVKDGDISLELKDQLIVSGNGKIGLPLETPKSETFPSVNGKNVVTISGQKIFEAFDSLCLAIGKDFTMTEYMEVKYDAEEVKLTITSMDSCIFCQCDLELEDANEDMESFSIVIKGKIIKSLIDVMKNEKSSMFDVVKTDENIVLSSSNVKICIPYENKEYIKYNTFLGLKFDKKVTFDNKVIKKPLTALSSASKDKFLIRTGAETGQIEAKDFAQPIQTINSDEIRVVLPTSMVKNIIGKFSGSVIFYLSEEGMVKITQESNNSVVYIIGSCKEL